MANPGARVLSGALAVPPIEFDERWRASLRKACGVDLTDEELSALSVAVKQFVVEYGFESQAARLTSTKTPGVKQNLQKIRSAAARLYALLCDSGDREKEVAINHLEMAMPVELASAISNVFLIVLSSDKALSALAPDNHFTKYNSAWNGLIGFIDQWARTAGVPIAVRNDTGKTSRDPEDYVRTPYVALVDAIFSALPHQFVRDYSSLGGLSKAVQDARKANRQAKRKPKA